LQNTIYKNQKSCAFLFSKMGFEEAAEAAKNLPVKPSNDDLLFLYSHYKQATVGNNGTTRPGMMDFTGKAKWDAWTKLKGMTTDQAKEKYIAKVNELKK
jgi:diazepam-binding inhibitor (GABA receptor modulator, acyl-CoA-binding protein)